MSTSTEKKAFSAITLRVILSVLLGVLLLGMAGGFYFVHSLLVDRASEVAEIQSEAQTSDARLQQLIALQRQLEQYTPIVNKAERIVAESQSYQYQNQIITDLNRYAAQAGVSISSFTFPEGTGSEAAAAPAPTETTGDAAIDGDEAATGSSETASAAPASGVRSIQVSIQIDGQPTYTQLLHFAHLVEQNVTRMQIAQLSLSGGEDGNTVGAQTLSIEVYIR